MAFKSLRKAASSVFRLKKKDSSILATKLSTSECSLALIQGSLPDTFLPIMPDIWIESEEGKRINATQNSEEETVYRKQVEHEVQCLRLEKLRELELMHRRQCFPVPKLNDGEYVISESLGRIKTSERTLLLWERGWVNKDTWLEDELKKMDADPTYLPMGGGPLKYRC